MNPLVSILIPTYNQPEYIVQCVESCLCQDYDNVEIVIGDDSTNESVFEALQNLIKNEKVRYHRNANNLGRVQNYRNLLFEHAKGEWAVMIDGDDYYVDLSFISKAISFINVDSSIVLVAASHFTFDEVKKNRFYNQLVEKDIKFDGKEIFYKNIKLGQHSTNLYRKELALTLDFYRLESMASDSEGLFRLCLHGKVVYLSSPVACWRIHNSNNTFRGEDALKQMHEMVFIDWVYKYALVHIGADSAKIWRKNMYKSMSYHILYLAEKSGNILYVFRVLFWASKYWDLHEIFNYSKSYFKKVFTSLIKNK